MTRIEAVAVIPAPPVEVWLRLLDHDRWPEWQHSADGSVRWNTVEVVSGPGDCIGTVRRCSATFSLLRRSNETSTTWSESVTDLICPWTLELEGAATGGLVTRWRTRFWLVEQPDGQTRLRLHLTYRPSWLGFVLDALVVRRRLNGWLLGAVTNLASTFAVAPESRLETGALMADAPPDGLSDSTQAACEARLQAAAAQASHAQVLLPLSDTWDACDDDLLMADAGGAEMDGAPAYDPDQPATAVAA